MGINEVDYLPEPSEKSCKLIVQGFEKKANFPRCIGTLDGKHIHVLSFPGSGSTNFSYKHYYSFVLLDIVNSDYKFVYVDIEIQ